MTSSLRLACPAALTLPAVFAACSREVPGDGAPASAAASASAAPAPAPPRRVAPNTEGAATRSGAALARTPDGKALILADEDHGVVRRIPLPVDVHAAREAVAMPGPPAQVVALADRVLVTVREPGLLVELVEDGGVLKERARVELPSDAWGLAVSADGKTAVVTSSWTHRITGVDLAELKVSWSIVAAREPRGVAIARDGTTYVSHLVGSRITRITGIDGVSPEAKRVEVQPAPLRSPPGRLLNASLAYVPVLSPDEGRLFLPRHAIGAQGRQWWFGQATVDVVLTKDMTSLAPRVSGKGDWQVHDSKWLADVQSLVALAEPQFVQPRAAVYRKSTQTLLVASEGTNVLVELDARALDPAMATKRRIPLGTYDDEPQPHPSLVRSGGAPTAIALSADEKTAWVFCRSTYDLAIVSIDDPGPVAVVHLADDPLDEESAMGRRLFYDATDQTVSGGLGCAGCHPEGRDDGHVWHEISSAAPSFNGYRGTSVVSRFVVVHGVPRQTPMLAGRVSAAGPYGWVAESNSLETRLRVGFSLHRWDGTPAPWQVTLDRPKWLASFVRKGLVAPKVPERALTPEEERGKELFSDANVACATCHVPQTELTNAMATPLQRPQPKGFDPEPDVAFKTPSLLFVGGTPPYYHDGAALSLEQLIRQNGKAMGDTARLRPEDQDALAAYVRTLGGWVEPFPDEEPPVLPEAPEIYVSPTYPGRPPQRAEWTKAEIVTGTSACPVRRIGNWVRVECQTGFIEQVAGSLASTQGSSTPNMDGGLSGRATFVFPLQPGDRRFVQTTFEEILGRYGMRLVPGMALSAYWLEGDAEPTLVGY